MTMKNKKTIHRRRAQSFHRVLRITHSPKWTSKRRKEVEEHQKKTVLSILIARIISPQVNEHTSNFIM